MPTNPNQVVKELTAGLGPYRAAFFQDLIVKTRNFDTVTWLGHPVWQNILDLWTIQETISDVKPGLLIECGTNRGGSALFFAHLFDLLGRGQVITVDIKRLHTLEHPRIKFMIGSSLDANIISYASSQAAAAEGPVLVILDSDHSAQHVLQEMEAYGPLVTPGSYMLVQDGVIDTLEMFKAGRPGPLVAIREFTKKHPEFEVDAARSERFLITHHPLGWLRRKAT